MLRVLFCVILCSAVKISTNLQFHTLIPSGTSVAGNTSEARIGNASAIFWDDQLLIADLFTHSIYSYNDSYLNYVVGAGPGSPRFDNDEGISDVKAFTKYGNIYLFTDGRTLRLLNISSPSDKIKLVAGNSSESPNSTFWTTTPGKTYTPSAARFSALWGISLIEDGSALLVADPVENVVLWYDLDGMSSFVIEYGAQPNTFGLYGGEQGHGTQQTNFPGIIPNVGLRQPKGLASIGSSSSLSSLDYVSTAFQVAQVTNSSELEFLSSVGAENSGCGLNLFTDIVQLLPWPTEEYLFIADQTCGKIELYDPIADESVIVATNISGLRSMALNSKDGYLYIACDSGILRAPILCFDDGCMTCSDITEGTCVKCMHGFDLKDGACQAGDACNAGVWNGGCDRFALCIDLDAPSPPTPNSDGRDCDCNFGYTGDGLVCEVVVANGTVRVIFQLAWSSTISVAGIVDAVASAISASPSQLEVITIIANSSGATIDLAIQNPSALLLAQKLKQAIDTGSLPPYTSVAGSAVIFTPHLNDGINGISGGAVVGVVIGGGVAIVALGLFIGFLMEKINSRLPFAGLGEGGAGRGGRGGGRGGPETRPIAKGKTLDSREIEMGRLTPSKD